MPSRLSLFLAALFLAGCTRGGAGDFYAGDPGTFSRETVTEVASRRFETFQTAMAALARGDAEAAGDLAKLSDPAGVLTAPVRLAIGDAVLGGLPSALVKENYAEIHDLLQSGKLTAGLATEKLVAYGPGGATDDGGADPLRGVAARVPLNNAAQFPIELSYLVLSVLRQAASLGEAMRSLASMIDALLMHEALHAATMRFDQSYVSLQSNGPAYHTSAGTRRMRVRDAFAFAGDLYAAFAQSKYPMSSALGAGPTPIPEAPPSEVVLLRFNGAVPAPAGSGDTFTYARHAVTDDAGYQAAHPGAILESRNAAVLKGTPDPDDCGIPVYLCSVPETATTFLDNTPSCRLFSIAVGVQKTVVRQRFLGYACLQSKGGGEIWMELNPLRPTPAVPQGYDAVLTNSTWFGPVMNGVPTPAVQWFSLAGWRGFSLGYSAGPQSATQ